MYEQDDDVRRAYSELKRVQKEKSHRGNPDLPEGVVLTKKQQEILSYIISHIKEYNQPPTISEVSKGVNIAANGIRMHLYSLERRGAIEIIRKNYRMADRGIKVLKCEPVDINTKL